MKDMEIERQWLLKSSNLLHKNFERNKKAPLD